MGAIRKIIPSRLKRGQVTILVAGVMLVFLLLFLVVGIDFARMYYVRGELQNAADAAALAGGKQLTGQLTDTAVSGVSNFIETPARQAAWRFACLNKAAQQNVFLEQQGSCDPASASTACCDSPPTSGLNEATNDPNGDIVVGYWSKAPVTCSSTGTTVQFCPANGLTGNLINAVKVRDMRVAGLEGSGRGSVGLLFGNIVGRSAMDVVRTAIAARLPRPTSGIAMCVSACPGPGSSVSIPNDFMFNVAGSTPTPYGISYTQFDTSSSVGTASCLNPTSSCNVSPTCPDNPNEMVAAYIWERRIAPAACGQITWSNGDAGARFDLACAFSSTTYDATNKTFNSDGTVATWNVVVPITDKCYSGSSPGGGSTGLASIVRFAEITIDSIVYSGGSGTGTPEGIHVINIACFPCDTYGTTGNVATLVR